MSKKSEPACYAMTHPGLEEIAADEIRVELRGEIKRTAKGLVVFRPRDLDRSLLTLRTTEDVFLFAWGTDELSYRAADLENIRKWTDRDADWKSLLLAHHQIRPKPKGKPSFHVVTQMSGQHGYRRIDARKAFWRGLEDKFPTSWREVEENAAVEFWLTIEGATAIAGIRLSDRSMRHRPYKVEHFPASLRPSMAAAMARLAQFKPNQVIVDPFCGAGTILAESAIAINRLARGQVDTWAPQLLGGDIDPHHLRMAQANLRKMGEISLRTWDARQLPLEEESVHRIVSNPPFGKQLSSANEVGPLYRQSVREMDRVLKPAGIAVLLVADPTVMKDAIKKVGWNQLRFTPVRILGQAAVILVYQKPTA